MILQELKIFHFQNHKILFGKNNKLYNINVKVNLKMSPYKNKKNHENGKAYIKWFNSGIYKKINIFLKRKLTDMINLNQNTNNE